MMKWIPDVRSDSAPIGSATAAVTITASGHVTSASLLPPQPRSVEPSCAWKAAMATT